jgi:hypothetical protein
MVDWKHVVPKRAERLRQLGVVNQSIARLFVSSTFWHEVKRARLIVSVESTVDLELQGLNDAAICEPFELENLQLESFFS